MKTHDTGSELDAAISACWRCWRAQNLLAWSMGDGIMFVGRGGS
jgi:hypothetical protein